jgi:4-hydroxy-tetrahydrodipicolinate synthase
MLADGAAGRVAEGRAHAEALLPLVRALFAEPNPAVVKALLHAEGRIPTPALRMPMAPASPAALERAQAALAAVPAFAMGG